jgi:hypothetical protein
MKPTKAVRYGIAMLAIGLHEPLGHILGNFDCLLDRASLRYQPRELIGGSEIASILDLLNVYSHGKLI